MNCNNLLIFERIFHAGIRSALSAFRTSPIVSLLYESGQRSLTHEICIKNLCYCFRTISNRHLEHFHPWGCFSSSTQLIEALQDFCNKININPNMFNRLESLPVPWLMNRIDTCLDLTSFKKNDYPPSLIRRQFQEMVKTYYTNERNELWLNTPIDNKLRLHKLTASITRNYCTGNRHEDTVITRVRIGHTRLTHQHLLKREPPPTCDSCNDELTVEHILVVCPKFNNKRQQHHFSGSLQDILKEDPNQTRKVIDFFKNINLFNEL